MQIASQNSTAAPDGAGHARLTRIAVSMAVLLVIAAGFGAVSAQLVRLALKGQAATLEVNSAQAAVETYSRPDIVDRNGRLLATDLRAYSLFADPAKVLDPDEAAESLARLLPGIEQRELRSQLADRTRRFVWIRRGLSAEQAQRLHDLGFPGLGFRIEPKRRYPQGRLAGHLIGNVNVDNKGISGLERHIDSAMGLVSGLAGDAGRPPVALTIDIGVQHGLEEELASAMARYRSRGAAGLVMDVTSGEVLAAASQPDIDPATPAEGLQADRIDRLLIARYELGSVFKMMTAAMALELSLAAPHTMIDVTQPLQVGGITITDPHPAGRPLSVTEVFVHSSNVGAGRLALMAGAERQRQFLQRLGLASRLVTQAGAATPPQLPERWGEVETVTIGYGHGIAVVPLQFAAAAAALVNGGRRIEPRFVRMAPGTAPRHRGDQVVRPEVSAMLREMMRQAVSRPGATGRRAAVDGYDVGGKTGTAELAVVGGYRETSVVSTFLAAFPIASPRYLLLAMLVEPSPTPDSAGQIAAGATAAPLAAAIIRRTGPLLRRMSADHDRLAAPAPSPSDTEHQAPATER